MREEGEGENRGVIHSALESHARVTHALASKGPITQSTEMGRVELGDLGLNPSKIFSDF